MATKKFEVEYNGVVVRCETVEEAVRVAREFGEGVKAPDTQPWKVHEFTEFVNRIQTQQRKLLAYLIQSRNPIAMDYELRGQLQLTNNKALAGVLSGISKVAIAINIDPQRVYGLHTAYKHGAPERRYYITQAFKQAAIDNDWPTASDLEFPNEPRGGDDD